MLAFIPNDEDVRTLEVGDNALNCFGEMRTVTGIFARDVNRKGKPFVCFYTERSATSQMSGSYASGEMIRTLALSSKYTSHELDLIERDMLAKGERMRDL